MEVVEKFIETACSGHLHLFRVQEEKSWVQEKIMEVSAEVVEVNLGCHNIQVAKTSNCKNCQRHFDKAAFSLPFLLKHKCGTPH